MLGAFRSFLVGWTGQDKFNGFLNTDPFSFRYNRYRTLIGLSSIVAIPINCMAR